MAIKLYHAPLSRSVRVRWLLEELGTDHEIVTLDFMGGDLQKPEFLARHPLGKVPVLEDGDLRLWESGAIVEYLCEKYDPEGRFAPRPGEAERGPYLQWVHFAEATAMNPIGDLVQHTMMRPENERIPAVAEDARRRIARWLEVLDEHLASRPYLLERGFTAADVMMGYTASSAKLTGQVGDRFPNVSAYLERLVARPAFQRATA